MDDYIDLNQVNADARLPGYFNSAGVLHGLVPNPKYEGKVKFEGVKHDDGKRRWDLFPWLAAEEIVKVLEFGAKKYEPHNWQKGMAWSRLFSATCRHLFAWWWSKEDKDPETGLSHLAHVGCCVLFALDYVLTKRGTDDRV